MSFQVPDDFWTELTESLFIQKPLPVDYSRSLERTRLHDVVCDEKIITGEWQNEGAGTILVTQSINNSANAACTITAPTTADKWPEDNPEGDYTPFCKQTAFLTPDNENWEGYNRIRFRVFPNCPGARQVYLEMFYINDGTEKVPDAYGREGVHCVNLMNGEWNECFWDIGEVARDKVIKIGFMRPAFGKDTSMGDFWEFRIEGLRLQTIKEPEKSVGWAVQENRIAYSHSGYEVNGKKTALAAYSDNAFFIVNGDGCEKFKADVIKVERFGETFAVLDFTPISEGTYSIKYGGVATPKFHVADGVFGASVWKVLNFIFCERCGFPVHKKHGNCHGDIIAAHNGVKIIYNGGWHDAGDLSQQTTQTAEVAEALMNAAEASCGPLRSRLLLEAEWGLEFLLKCRFGDGFYATSAGLVHWSDGKIGNFDDRPARVHNNAIDNYLISAVYSKAAKTLEDKALAERLEKLSIEDFNFAENSYKKIGCADDPLIFEHIYNTPHSTFMAARAYGACEVYAATKDLAYEKIAVDAARYLIECQNTEPIGGVSGFFYRDDSKKVIAHFTHQSREELFAKALAALLKNFPNHADQPLWMKSIKLYAKYIKDIYVRAKPWGLLPAGIFSLDEFADKPGFERQHIYVRQEIAERDFIEQVTSGEKLDEMHYIKMFPVWLSFRGNCAIHLSQGRGAAICSRVLHDRHLAEIAREQLYWIVGKNPFCQSLMFGEGHNYSDQAVFLPGTMTGQLPVGIQTRHNGDAPYWPHTNNATYKEAWLTVAGKWLNVAAELENLC